MSLSHQLPLHVVSLRVGELGKASTRGRDCVLCHHFCFLSHSLALTNWWSYSHLEVTELSVSCFDEMGTLNIFLDVHTLSFPASLQAGERPHWALAAQMANPCVCGCLNIVEGGGH